MDPMPVLPAAVVPRDLVMPAHPKTAVHSHLLHFDLPIRLVVAGGDFVMATRQAVVEQDLGLPRRQLVAVEQDFAYPTQRVAVEQDLGLPRQLVEEGPGLPTHWAVALVDPKDW